MSKNNLSDRELKGRALRVGGEIWVPPNATEADHEAAWSMMTLAERKRTAKQIVRVLRWAVWRMKHPRLSEWLDAAAHCGMVMLTPRGF